MSLPFPPSPRRARLARLRRLKTGLPRQKIARRSGSDAPRNPLFSRAGGSTLGSGPLPAGRATRGLGFLVVGALALIGARWGFNQRFDLGGEAERIVRAQFLPQLEKQLGEKVEIGAVETDWLGRVTVRDVVIGRDARLPTGALGRAKSIVISLDLPGLALHRTSFPAAIQQVALDGPQIYLTRDRRGFNWQKLLGSSSGGAKTSWTGRVTATNGRLYYRDTALPSASGQPLILDLQGVAATFNANGDAPYHFDIAARQPFFGAKKQLWQPISSQGTLDSKFKTGLIAVQSQRVPLRELGNFAFPRRDVILRGGDASGSVQLSLSESSGGTQITPRGAVEVRGGAATLTTLREPNSSRPLQIDALSGPVRFVNRAFSSPGARFRALDTDFGVQGAASLENGPVFDAQLTSAALATTRLRSLLPPSFPGFSSGAMRLNTHISGTARSISADGTLEAPQARFSDSKTQVRAAFPLLRAAFVSHLDFSKKASLNWQVATRFSAPDGTIITPQGEFSAAFDGTVRGAQSGGLEVTTQARNFALQSARWGQSRGQNLQISATTASLSAPRWNGVVRLDGASTAQLQLAKIAPAVSRAVSQSGQLSGAAQFSDLDFAKTNQARVGASFALSGLDLNAAAFGSPSLLQSLPLQSGDFHLSALRGRLDLRAGQLEIARVGAISAFGPLRLDASVPLSQPQAARIALTLPDIRLGAARFAPFLRAQNLALDGDFRGRLSLLSQTQNRFGLDFDLSGDAATGRGLGRGGARFGLVAPRLRGRAEFDVANFARSWNGAATVDAAFATLGSGALGRFATVPATFSGARARGLHLNLVARGNAASGNAASQSPKWSGELRAQSLSAPLPVARDEKPRFVSLTRANALLATTPGGVEISRFSAGFGRGSLIGTAKIAAGTLRARLLAQQIDLAGLQNLLAPASRENARVVGLGSARIEILPDQSPRAEVRLSRATLTLAAGGAPFDLSGARATVALQNGAVSVQNALLWSDGARLSGSARLNPNSGASSGAQWTGELAASGVSLARLAALPFARDLASPIQPEGLLGGDFSFRFDAKNPRHALVSGPATLRLATVAGAGLDAVRAQVRLQNGATGWKVAATEVAGTIENAPFGGEISADSLSNEWQIRLATQNLRSDRLARLGALRTAPLIGPPALNALPNQTQLERALPIRGVVGADIDLSGPLFSDGFVFTPRARSGFVRVSSGPLDWRGETIGSLRADLEVENGVARAKTLQLMAPGTGTNGANGAALVSLSGQLPLDLSSPALDAHFQVAPAPLSFFTSALTAGRDALARSGATVPLLDRAVSYVAALPAGTTGRVALDADLSGAWRAPRVRVSSLTLRDGRTRVPAGGFSPPATLDAAFSYENGTIKIEKTEFRLKKLASPASISAAGSPGGSSPSVSDEEDDTLLRIEPGGSASPDGASSDGAVAGGAVRGGAVSLSADVFNANLSQLSTWVPALRDSNGAPLLRGELTEFSFRVGGPLLKPVVTGSIQAENISFNAYTLDRLRVSRFDIGETARVEPGNLTIVKGGFQSSSAYGQVPWSWAPLGPVRGGAIDVHFPLQTRDFGALGGVLLPASSVANAEEFGGSVDVSGTIEAPQISGAISIRGGQLRLDSQQNTLQTGLSGLSGTVRFVGGNQLQIDADDPLRGRLVPASTIVGRPTRREEAPPLPPAQTAIAGSGPDPKRGAKTKTVSTSPSTTAAARRAATAAASPNAPQLGGEWVLRGSVTRPEVIERDTPERRTPDRAALTSAAALVASLRYDLQFSLDKGLFKGEGLPGVEDISLGVIWKTGAAGPPQNAQNLRWMLAARGQKFRKLKNGGQLISLGCVELPRDFAAGIEALGRARPLDFVGEADFDALAVRRRFDFSRLADRRTQISFNEFAASLTGTGNGVIDGRLVLDNRPAVQRAPGDAVGLQRASLSGRGPAARLFGPSFDAAPIALQKTAREPRIAARSDVWETETQPETPESETPEAAAPLRLGGNLTLQNAEIYGAGGGGEGGVLLLSRLPAAPLFDVKLSLGRDVAVVTSSFRASLGGELVASGTPRSPQILGVLQTLDGQVRFPNARARVEEGRVSLSLTRDPETDGLKTRVEIDATARGQAGAYTISLHMRGPLDLSAGSTQSLNIDVTSNPPLSQDQAFEQLLGTVPNVARQEDGTFKAGTLNRAYTNAIVNVLSAPLFAGVEQTLAQTLGLTSVGFEYRFNEPLAIQFTKTLGDRVFVSYRRSLGSGPTSSFSGNPDGRTPFELRIDYRIKGDYLLGLQTDERQLTSITLQRSRQF